MTGACASSSKGLAFFLAFAAIEAGVVYVWPGFEAAVHPKVLNRRLADFLLNDGVDAGSILQVIAAREIFQRLLEINVVARFIFDAEVADRHYLAFAALHDPVRGGNAAGRK